MLLSAVRFILFKNISVLLQPGFYFGSFGHAHNSYRCMFVMGYFFCYVFFPTLLKILCPLRFIVQLLRDS